MRRKIGRFDAYVPDHDPYEIVKKCISVYSCGGQKKLDSMPHEIHRFFFEIKKEYPEVLKILFLDMTRISHILNKLRTHSLDYKKPDF